MVLVIIMALIIASPVTMGFEMVSIIAMTTSALIIAIVIIIIASVGGIKLSAVALVLAPVIILLSPSPMLGSFIWFPTTVLTPIGSVASIKTSIKTHYESSCLPLHTVPLAQGEGEVVEAVVEI